MLPSPQDQFVSKLKNDSTGTFIASDEYSTTYYTAGSAWGRSPSATTGVDSLSTDVVPGIKVPFLFLVQLVLRSTIVRIRIRTAVMCVAQDPACDTR